jgi:tRNA(Ile)-lysidine synthase
MPAVRPLHAADTTVQLLRPLLAMSRARLLDEARARGLSWVDDESNADAALGRNFLRHRILPTLEARWPGSAASLARAADHFAAAAQLLDALARADLERAPPAAVPGAPHALALSALAGLDEARAGNLLRYWLRGAGLAVPPAVRLDEWLRQLRDGGTAAEMRLEGWLALRYRDALVLLPDDHGPFAAQPWHGEAALPRGRGEVSFGSAPGGLRLEGVAVELRCRRPVDRFRPRPGAPSRSLKNLLQEAGVPPVLRARLPLLACGSEVLWLPFVGISAARAAGPDEQGMLPQWRA